MSMKLNIIHNNNFIVGVKIWLTEYECIYLTLLDDNITF